MNSKSARAHRAPAVPATSTPVDPVGPRPRLVLTAPKPYTPPLLPHLRLRCVLDAREPAELPAIKGSMLRGAFGQALRRLVCLQPADTPCGDCALRAGCAYGGLFENVVEGTPPPLLGGTHDAPRPYLVEVVERRLCYQAGDRLTFDLILIGQAAAWQGHALKAVDIMAENGLGARRHPFVLTQARYTDEEGEWHIGFARGDRRWQPVSARAAKPEPLGETTRLRFLTPTRMVVAKQPVVQFDFRTLAFKMLRRQLELAHFHCPSVHVDWDYRAYLDRANSVAIRRATLKWEEWRRWSNRQRRHITLGGVVGEIELEGDLAPFAPLLCNAEVVHVGKSAAFGFGRVAVSS